LFGRRATLVLTLCAVSAAGCGGGGTSTSSSGASMPVAARVCARAHQAAAAQLHGPVSTRVANSDPANVECVLKRGRARVDVVAQASPQAWTEFDTTQSHQDQVYGPGIHTPGQIPRNESVGSMLAQWIPAKNQLFATNGTPTRGGSYVTVTVTRGPSPDAARARLAQAVGVATRSGAPRGADPG
jgi:hypothetical protein